MAVNLKHACAVKNCSDLVKPVHSVDPAFITTVFAQSVAAATNVFNLSRREATIQERLLFESGVYLSDCALPQELNDYVMVFVNV